MPWAQAKEGTPVGGADQRVALIPPPGTYIVYQYVNSHAPELTGLDNEPHPFITDFDLKINLVNATFIHVWDAKLLGGSLTTIVSPSAARTCMRQNGRKDCTTGWFDSYFEPVLWGKNLGLFGAEPPSPDPSTWRLPYGLNITAGIGLFLPTGKFNPNNVSQNGTNVLLTIPHVDFSYVSGPWWGDGTEFSGRFSYAMASKDDETGYQAGEVLSAEFSLSQRFGLWQIGPTLTLAKGITGDFSDNPLVQATLQNEGKMTLVQPGFVVTRDFPEQRMSASVKVLTEVYTENRVTSKEAIILRLSHAW